MQKQILERFISKYTLGGLIEILPWKSDGIRTTIEAGSENKMVVVHLSSNGLVLPVGEYCIYETSQLRSLLGILGDDITIDVKTVKDKMAALTFRDDSAIVDFALADPQSMPKNMAKLNAENLHDDMWNVMFDADVKFTSAFARAKSALNAEEFTVKIANNEVQVILGYAEYGNTTRATIKQPGTINAKLSSIKFNANCLREVLMANKELSGQVRVAEDGLMHVHYHTDEFTADYYLSALMGID